MAPSTTYSFPDLESEITGIIQESEATYMLSSSAPSISISDFFADKFLMITVIQRGVSYKMFQLIKNLAPFSEETWASFLDVSTKSLQRYKQSAKSFKPIQSEKIIAMAEVTHMGTLVFGSLPTFKLWLETPNFSLGNKTPLALLKDSYGKELVLAELTRIQHGIFV
ncbi:MAG: DUF2384 domain-containing protein [Bacteroidetes bacterium]|nr:MAG: DUF2384 domain-containing protein [Bacteroidota bacterium]